MNDTDIVFHTASPPASETNYDILDTVNVKGTKVVVEVCKEAGVKV